MEINQKTKKQNQQQKNSDENRVWHILKQHKTDKKS